MELEWDAAKDEANRRKHGFDFTYAIRIFDGPVRYLASPPESRGAAHDCDRPSRRPVHQCGLYSSQRAVPDHFRETGAAE